MLASENTSGGGERRSILFRSIVLAVSGTKCKFRRIVVPVFDSERWLPTGFFLCCVVMYVESHADSTARVEIVKLGVVVSNNCSANAATGLSFRSPDYPVERVQGATALPPLQSAPIPLPLRDLIA